MFLTVVEKKTVLDNCHESTNFFRFSFKSMGSILYSLRLCLIIGNFEKNVKERDLV